MATTKEKLNKLQGQDYSATSNNLMFPSDLLADGTDGLCMTLFVNTIKNGAAKLTFNGANSTKNSLSSPYGEVPVIHNVSTGLQGSKAKIFSDTYVRSDQSVTLPMPRNFTQAIQANWTTMDMGAGSMAIDQITDIGKIMKEGGGGALAARLGMGTIGSIAAQFAGGAIKGKEMVELGTATVANNYSETLFKTISNRSFTWSWTLTPRNAKEAAMIDAMLRLLRFHMLPEFKANVGNGNAFLLYPSSFDIVFWLNGAPNTFIPRVATCAMTNIDTNYAPNGQFIKMVDGAPQSYILSLSFTELSVLHKAMVGSDSSGTNTTF